MARRFLSLQGHPGWGSQDMVDIEASFVDNHLVQALPEYGHPI
jgi:hypothetical protein